MKMIDVMSSNVESIGWENNTLFVKYKQNGITYSYDNVPENVFNDLMNAPSHGRFVNESIKPYYTCTRL